MGCRVAELIESEIGRFTAALKPEYRQSFRCATEPLKLVKGLDFVSCTTVV
jgi:hypothetical protein